MDSELIFDYILWKRLGIQKVIETKKEFFYGVSANNLKDFEKFIGRPITIITMKKLEEMIEKKEDKPYLCDKSTGKLQDLEQWLEQIFQPRVIDFVEKNYEEYVSYCVERNSEYLEKEDFAEQAFRRMLDEEDIEVVDIYNIQFSYSKVLDFDKCNKIIRYKEEDEEGED